MFDGFSFSAVESTKIYESVSKTPKRGSNNFQVSLLWGGPFRKICDTKKSNFFIDKTFNFKQWKPTVEAGLNMVSIERRLMSVTRLYV